MRYIFQLAFGCAALVTTVAQADVVPEGVVRMSARHKHVLAPKARKSKRDDTVSAPLAFNAHWVPQGGYFIESDVGTPPQKFEMLLDTGSANFYVPKSSAATCEQYLCPGGSFNTEDSSTFANVRTPAPLRLSYADGSTVNGTYVSDTVSVAGATLNKFIFAVADQLQVSPNQKNGPQYGIMGVAYDAGQSSTSFNSSLNFTTPTIPDALYSGGYIKSRSYSLYLDDIAAKSGSILFGGIDTAKFTGEMITLGVPKEARKDYNSYGLYDYNSVFLTSVSGKVNGTTTKLTQSNYTGTVLLDSGNTGMGLPPSVFKQIIPYLPVQENEGSYYILCKDAAKVDASLIFGLYGTNGQSVDIEVPLVNFAAPAYTGDYNSTTPLQSQGEDVCTVAVYPDSETYPSFGDPFLRSAYAFYDLSAHTISLAQLSYDSTSSSITPVSSGVPPKFTGTGTNTSPPGVGSSSSAAPSASASSNGGVIVKADSAFFFAAFSAVSMLAYFWWP